MSYAYPCQLNPDGNGDLVATFPDVPEAIIGNTNCAAALEMAEGALAIALAGYVHVKGHIPPPSAAGQALVPVSAAVAAKLALYSAVGRQGITKVELARRLGISEAAVHSLADPDHRSHIGQVEKALRAVAQSMVVRVGDREL